MLERSLQDRFYGLTYEEEEHKLLIEKARGVYIVVEKPVKMFL